MFAQIRLYGKFKMTIKPLIDYFENFLPLNEEEKTAVEDSFKERRIKRRQFILQEGDICKHNTFVIEGCFRTYMIDEKGKEHNLQFAIENWWIGDIGSFHSEKPSKLNIEAIENAVILQCKKEDQLKLFVNYPKFNRIFRVLAENAMVSLQNRILQNISSTAEERYLDFVERFPQFFNRISNVQIASYLGVTPEFLSAIRKKIAES
jgi:CRP-like cAMP-binding protein